MNDKKAPEDETQEPTTPFQNVGKRLIHIAGIKIIPGATGQVPDRYLEGKRGVRSSSVVKAGELVEGTGFAMPAPLVQRVPSELSQLPEPNALAMVKLSNDPAKLRQWSENEQRQSVANAITAKLLDLAAKK